MSRKKPPKTDDIPVPDEVKALLRPWRERATRLGLEFGLLDVERAEKSIALTLQGLTRHMNYEEQDLRLIRPRGDCFAVLGLSPPCTRDAVQEAYRRLARERHPDRGGSKEAFQELQDAYGRALNCCH
jgi:hypothetical protein